MLADFALRLAFGLAAMLAGTSWRAVPPAFFRTQCLVILGLLVLAALDASRASAVLVPAALPILAGVGAYLAAVAWGLGLVRIAVPATAGVGLLTAAGLILASQSDRLDLWAFNSLARLASGFLLGATLSAMLLGHHYLTAPTMTIQPLKASVRCIGVALVLRAMLAFLGLAIGSLAIASQTGPFAPGSPLFLTMRWGMGLLAPAAALVLTWRTVQLRSTQSATGILYATMTLVLFGELASLIGSQGPSPIL